MNKRLISVLLITILIGSCAPVPASSTQPPPFDQTQGKPATATQTFVSSETPLPTQVSIPVPTITNFLVSQIRSPSENDGREVMASFWSLDGSSIYYALADGISDTLLWFELKLSRGQVIEDIQLSSPPTIYYPPNLPGGLYYEHQGLISPSKRYNFQIIQTENPSLYLLDSVEHSKVKLLETPDMNFRCAYWMPGENSVVFGIGPEYGTELYLYDIEERKLSSSKELIGYEDWNLWEWTLSPDGKYIAILDGDQSLRIFSMDNSFSATVPGHRNNVRWAGNSQRIYFYYGDQFYDPTNIGYFDLNTKTSMDVMPLSELEKFGVDINGFFDVSPDRNQLVFWQAGDIWLLSLE